MRRPVLVLLAVVLAGVLAHQYQVRIRQQMVDFEVYRTAAMRVVRAEPLYQPTDGHYQFKYLPAFALAMVPFGRMSDETGRLVWFVLSVGWLVWLVAGAVIGLPERHLSASVLTVVTIALMAKFFGHELTLGQANALFGAVLITAVLRLGRGQPTFAAVLFGLAVFVKPYALLFWPWLALTRPTGRPAAIMAVVVATGLALPAILYGWHGNLDLLAGWFRTVTQSTEPNLLDTDNISLAALAAKWLGPGRLATAAAIGLSLAVMVLIVALIRGRRRVATPAFAEAAAIMLAMPLLSPQGWDYVLLLGTPAVACVVDRWRDLGPAWRTMLAVALLTMSVTTYDVMGRAAYVAFMQLALVTLAALALLATLGRLRAVRAA